MDITYKINTPLRTEDVIEVYRSSGINRPLDEPERIAGWYAHSNLVVSAWQGAALVGVARSLTDFSYCCYLSDLAVKKDLQHKGIGKELIRITKEKIGDDSMLLLLSAPAAMDYYPKIGMNKVENGFIIPRMIKSKDDSH